jgi:hypothetical protein
MLVVIHTYSSYLGCKVLVKVALKDEVDKGKIYEAHLEEKEKSCE